MTVRVLSEAQKDLVLHYVRNEHFSIKDVAKAFQVSPTTVGRALDERQYCSIPKSIPLVPFTEQVEMELRFTQKLSWWQKLRIKLINWMINGPTHPTIGY